MRTSLTLAQKKKDIERAGRPMASKKERGSPSDTSEASLAENRLVSPSATDSPAGEVDDHQDSSKAPVDAADLNLREKAVNTTVREGPGSTAAKDPVLSVEDTEGQTASDGESSEESLQQDSPTDGQGSPGAEQKRVQPYTELDLPRTATEPPPSKTELQPDSPQHAVPGRQSKDQGSIGSILDKCTGPTVLGTLRTRQSPLPSGTDGCTVKKTEDRGMPSSEAAKRLEPYHTETPPSGQHTPELKVFRITVPQFAGDRRYLARKEFEPGAGTRMSKHCHPASGAPPDTTAAEDTSASRRRMYSGGGLTPQSRASPRSVSASPSLTSIATGGNRTLPMTERDQQLQELQQPPEPPERLATTSGRDALSTDVQLFRSSPTSSSTPRSRRCSNEDTTRERDGNKRIDRPYGSLSGSQHSSQTVRVDLRDERAVSEDDKAQGKTSLSGRSLSTSSLKPHENLEPSRVPEPSYGRRSPRQPSTPLSGDSPERKDCRRQQQPYSFEPAWKSNPRKVVPSRSGSSDGHTAPSHASSTWTRPDSLFYQAGHRQSVHPACVEASRNVMSPPQFVSTTTQGFSANKGVKAFFKSQPPAASILCVVLLVVVLAVFLFLLGFFRPEVGTRHGTLRVCRTEPCREYARRLRATLNTSLNPCEGFSRFVCDGWWRRSQLSVREEAFLGVLREMSSLLSSVPVPTTGQTTLQRAAAFYRSCDGVLQGRSDQLLKVKRALLDAGIVWPLLPKDSNRVDLLRTWFHASIRLRWSPLLHVVVQRAPNFTTVVLEPLSDFERILRKHKGLEASDHEAKVYFEELRREFGGNREYDNAEEDDTTVSFAITKDLARSHLAPLRHAFEDAHVSSGLDTAFMFGKVPGLNRQRWLQELESYAGTSGGDVIFVSKKPSFVREFLGLWSHYGENQMHLFFSWCVVQTAALFANQKLLFNFYTRELRAELYHGAMCLSKVYLLSGSEVFREYYDQVLSGRALHSAQHLVADIRGTFAARLEQWPYLDARRTVVQDWNNTDVVLGYFDPRSDQRSLKPKPAERSFPDMNASLVDNWQAVNLDHVDANERAASARIEFAEWFTLLPGRDMALLPYALSFPWVDESATPAMNHGGLGYRAASALSRLFTDSYITSPEAAASIQRALECAANGSSARDDDNAMLRQIEGALALDVSLKAYLRRSAALGSYDELLEGFEAYGGAALFFIAACYSACLGSENILPSAVGDECDDTFRNVEGFSYAFGCAPGSAMNPSVKCGILT